MNKKTIFGIVVGGSIALFAVYQGHYLYKFVFINKTLAVEDWIPFWAPLPAVNNIDWKTSVPIPLREDITMVMSHTPNIAGYADLSAAINENYCKSHGYKFFLNVGDKSAPDRSPCWDKVHWLSVVAKSEKPPKRMFWIDSDAIINRPERMLESFEKYDADICICTSTFMSKMINTGAMYVRNTPWTQKFLEKWWEWPDMMNSRWKNEKFHEQSALDEMLARDVLQCRTGGHIALFNCTAFNSNWTSRARSDLFIHHYKGAPFLTRKTVFEARKEKLHVVDDVAQLE